MPAYYARWTDDDGVTHWVESEINKRLFTSCGRQVKTEGWFAGKPSFKSTFTTPNCIACFVEADHDIWRSPPIVDPRLG